MGGCSKTLKFVITIITWWVGVTKKCNCPLLFVTNLWCSHFFLHKRNFSTSQAKKKELLFFKPKVCLFLDNCETKKCFYCLAQQHCCLDKKKKKHLTLFVCFLFPSFWNLEEKNNSEKDKTKKRFFFSKASVLCFVFGHGQTLPQTKWAEFWHLSQSFVDKGLFFFLFVNQKSQHLLFEEEVFRKVLFVLWTKYIWHKSLRKKGFAFFPLAKTKGFVVTSFPKLFSLFFSQMFNFGNIFKSFNRVFNKKTSTQITNDYYVGGCLKNNHFSITNITRWVGLQKKLNC